MPLVDTKESKDAGTSPERAAMEVYAAGSEELSAAAPILVRKGQHLDVDGILARSLPHPGTFGAKDVKTIVLRAKPSEVLAIEKS